MSFPLFSATRLRVFELVAGLLALSVLVGNGQGVGFEFDSSSYTVTAGNPVSGTVSITPVYDVYDSEYEEVDGVDYDYFGFETVTYVHYNNPLYGEVSLSGPGSQILGWPANNFGSEPFSFSTTDTGTPGPDVTETLSVSENDPEYEDVYWDYCFYYNTNDDYAVYCNPSTYSPASPTVTILNPNSVMQVGIEGEPQPVEGEGQGAVIEIYCGDSYNTRTVYYSISGDAVEGLDYDGSLSGSVTIPAGSSSADIPITALDDQLLVGPVTLTVTLSENNEYQVGANSSVTLTFLPEEDGDDQTGTAQTFRPTSLSFNDLNASYSRGNSNVNGTGTNGLISSSLPTVEVQTTYPYAASLGPTPGVFTITCSGCTNAFTVNYTITGTAIAGTNYAALPSSVTFTTNLISTNLLVNALTNPLTAQTVVLTLAPGTNYFVEDNSQAVVTILPNSSLTNSVTSPTGRYWRGSGSDPTYWSQVIPLDSETGTVYSNLNGNCSSLYPRVTSWTNQILYHYNATNSLRQANIANRIAFNNPIVAFGERVGGTPLYIGQPYNFGIYAGNPTVSNQPVVIEVFSRTNAPLITTNVTVTTSFNYNWTSSTLPLNAAWYGLAYGNGTFVAISGDGGNSVAYSTNAVNWSSSTLPSSGDNWQCITYGDSKFVAIDTISSLAAYSANGIAWTACTLPVSNNWAAVTYGDNKFVAIAYDPTDIYGYNSNSVAYSANGVNWTSAMLPSSSPWQDVTYGNGMFVAVGGETNGAYSTNGINWTASALPPGSWAAVAYGDGVFTAVAYGETNAAYSTDGINWSASPPLPYAADWGNVIYANDIFSAIALGTNAAFSVDGTNWISSALPASANWANEACGNGLLVAVAYYSSNAAYATFTYTTNITYTTNYHLAGTISIFPPNPSNTNSMVSYATNGFQITTNAFGLSTTLSDSPSLTWGASSLGAYVLTHTASSEATNYYYVVEEPGYPGSNTNAMVINSAGVVSPSLLYTLEFEERPPWRSTFLDQPQFDGSPLPPFYDGMTLEEMLTNTPPVTNVVNFNPADAITLDDSPELRRSPILDNFVASMNNDPIALANYVINQIDLTDPMAYSDDGNVSEQSINPGGVSRGALGTFLEKEGSPIDQCALLVYLLRQAGVPAAYEFAPPGGLQILDERLSEMLQFQVQGAYNEAGQLYTTNTMIAVNYPWVAAYIGTNWVHIFPWLKDYEITEGLDLYDYMPTNYSSAYPWVRDYVYGNANLLSLATNGDNTPSSIFPAFLQQTLQQNYPGISIDDIGVQILNRQHNYARWQDFPTPTWVTNVSTPIESLASSAITNVNPALTNIFDTVSVEIYSVANPTNAIQTGNMRLTDLFNREFYINQTINTNNTNQVNLSLILVPYSTNITTQYSFTNDPELTSKEVLSMTLRTNENQLEAVFQYQRNRALTAASPMDISQSFFGLNAIEDVTLERPLLKGDQAAICMDYGRVTQDMLNVYAQDLWQMEAELQLNPSLTNSISQDVYEGAALYLAGMSYYKNISDFDQVNRNLNKIYVLSSFAVGLSKLGAARDSSGNLLNNSIDPVLPGVDMFYYQTAEVGNGTVQPNSGQTLEMAQQNYDLISIANNSAEEHQIIDNYYDQTNAVSTVRLLQLAQTQGSGVVALNYNNYVTEGQTVYQGLPLQEWDPTLWAQVANALQNSPYTIAYITPGPISNGSYTGTAALVLGWNEWEALISPQSLNGGTGQPLPADSVSQDNTVNYNLNNGAPFVLTLTAPTADSAVAPTSSSLANYQSTLNDIENGDYALTTFNLQFNSQANSWYNVSFSANQNQDDANIFDITGENGDLGDFNDGNSTLFGTIGDPVRPLTGEFYINETDLQLPGPMPLTLRRNYSSQNLADNQFGTGWKLNLMPYLSVALGGTNIAAADMDGAVIAYIQTATNSTVWMPTLAANPQLNNNAAAGMGSVFNRLRNRIMQTVSDSTTNYILYGADGSTRIFQVTTFDNGILNCTRPYLQTWTDSCGNYYTFTYGTDPTQPNFGEVTRIQSSNGNYLGFDYDINGHVIDAYTGDGRWLYYIYNDYGDLTSVTLPDNTTHSYQYLLATAALTNGTATYSTHLITEEDMPEGRVLQNYYDSQRRVTNQWSTAGTAFVPIRTGTFIYANNFNITNSYTNTISGDTLIIDGNVHTNRFDYTNSLITKITDPLGYTIQQVWFTNNTSAAGYYPRSVQQRTDRRGLVTQYQYDSNGNVTNTILNGDLTGDGTTSQAATNTASYNANNLPVQVTDAVGNSVVTIYDPVFNFRPQQIIHYAGATPVCTNYLIYGDATNVVVDGDFTQTNEAFGLLERRIRAYGSPDAATNDIFYSGSGFPVETIRYTGMSDPDITNFFFYNEQGDQEISEDALGAITYSEFDELDRPIERENFDEFGNPLALNQIYYDDNGEVSWTDGPRYNPDNYVFYDRDGAGRVTTEIQWRSQANRNANGQVDGSGVQAPSGYNLYAQTFYEYDPLGNLLLKVDPRDAMTTNVWNADCELVQTTHLDTNGVTVLSTEGYGYEPGGEVRYYTNALGGVTSNLYTITGKLEFRSNPDGSTNAWRYYLDGRIYKEIQRNGAYWLTIYDDVDRITTRVFYSPSGVPEATNSVQLDRRGNVIQKVDAGGNIFTTTFDGLDRPKIAAGPSITTVEQESQGMTPPTTNSYVTNILQQTVTSFYDIAGRAVTNVNAMGETTISSFDAIQRPISTQVYSASGTLVHESYTTYSPDHNSVTVTDGSGPSAIVHTTYTDTEGHNVLSIAYPSSGVMDYTWEDYDLSGNLDYQERDTSSGGSISQWTFASFIHDGLNRLTEKIDRDDAITTYAYDPMNDLANRTTPGGIKWLATYNNVGLRLKDWNIGGTSGVRTNTYAYFATGSPFVGLLQTRIDGRNTTNTYSYDNWLRVTNEASTGLLPEQNLTTMWQYEPRGYITGITETFASTNTGPTTSIQRCFDPYGQLVSESVSAGSFSYGDSQNWDPAGRRSMLNFGADSYGFGWQADGNLISASDPTGTGNYSFDTAGILTGRSIGNTRSTTITARDGEGRPLAIITDVNGSQQLNESLVYNGDGSLASHMVRGDFTDSRSYEYANLSRRLTYEQLNLNAGSTWTNSFTYDNGTAAGPGVLTQMGQINGNSGDWEGATDSLSRVTSETNNTFSHPAYGHVNGQASLSAWLDSQPISITASGTNTMQWEATMQLSPGTHQLKVAALHPSGFFTAWATNSFTNSLAYQSTVDAYNNEGEITNRVWKNPSGAVERTQTLSWDARGRLHAITQRDANNSGYNWTAAYDGLNRRLETTTVLVSNGVASTAPPQVISSYYDPQVEFLELGVACNSQTVWKLYGPDLNGKYGGLNGTGGFDGFSPYLNLFDPVISDARGNILAEITNGVVAWTPARPTGYGAVPGYQPAAFGNGADLAQSSAWRGHWLDITGLYSIGMRYYDPISGRWLSFDPAWNERDPNGYTFAGGEPIMGFDADGRISTMDYSFENMLIDQEFSSGPQIGVDIFPPPQSSQADIDQINASFMPDFDPQDYAAEQAWNNMSTTQKILTGIPYGDLGYQIYSDASSGNLDALGEDAQEVAEDDILMLLTMGLMDVPVETASPTSAASQTATQLEFPFITAVENQTTAYNFYKAATGWSDTKIASHLNGIDFNQPVSVVELPAGTPLIQYQIPGNAVGNYFAAPGTSANTLGIYTSGLLQNDYILSNPLSASVQQPPPR